MSAQSAIEKKTDRSPEELYEEREKRLRDAIQLKEPDRVPVVMGGTYFATKYVGLPYAAAYYDFASWKAAYQKMLLDFEPDAYGGSTPNNSGLVMEALDERQTKWPGGTLPPDIPHQFVEGEYMKEDEYDLFLSDPSDFTFRCYLPRVFAALEPLSRLPSLKTWLGGGFAASTSLFATPEFQHLFEALVKAGQEQARWRKAVGNLDEEMAALGFPHVGHGTGAGGAPFDSISDNLRGMRGTMIDMYRRPEKLMAACEKILEWRLARATPADPRKRGNPKIATSALHRGSEGFMSRKQFETFYWPGLKKALLATLDLGFVPLPFFEGKCDDRLDYILELPKGRVVCRFSETDMTRAKSVLGNHCCIMGSVPSTLLQVGSVQEVEEYCRNLIKVCGKGGGFIMRASTDAIEEANPVNVKAMVDSVRKWGWYR